jgi:serine/threonine protein kinase
MNAANNIMMPKAGMTEQEILKKRFKKFDESMSDKISKDCIDVLHKIFELSPVRRISATEVLKHPFFSKPCSQPTGNKSSVVTKQSNVNRTTESTSPALNSNWHLAHKKVYL